MLSRFVVTVFLYDVGTGVIGTLGLVEPEPICVTQDDYIHCIYRILTHIVVVIQGQWWPLHHGSNALMLLTSSLTFASNMASSVNAEEKSTYK